MSAFIDLTQSARMSTEELSHLLSEIESKSQTEPRCARTLLQIIAAANLRITQIERADAEKRLRKVAAMPLQTMAFFSDREELKRLCKEVLTQWGVKRRQVETQSSQLSLMFAKISQEEEKKTVKPQSPKFRPHEIQSTGFLYRDRLRARLVDILRRAQVATQLSDAGWPLDCALRLENEVYRLFKHGKPYTDKARSLIHNLEDTKNSNA